MKTDDPEIPPISVRLSALSSNLMARFERVTVNVNSLPAPLPATSDLLNLEKIQIKMQDRSVVLRPGRSMRSKLTGSQLGSQLESQAAFCKQKSTRQNSLATAAFEVCTISAVTSLVMLLMKFGKGRETF